MASPLTRSSVPWSWVVLEVLKCSLVVESGVYVCGAGETNQWEWFPKVGHYFKLEIVTTKYQAVFRKFCNNNFYKYFLAY